MLSLWSLHLLKIFFYSVHMYVSLCDCLCVELFHSAVYSPSNDNRWKPVLSFHYLGQWSNSGFQASILGPYPLNTLTCFVEKEIAKQFTLSWCYMTFCTLKTKHCVAHVFYWWPLYYKYLNLKGSETILR